MFDKMKTVYFTLLYCVLGLSLAANYGFYSGSVAMGAGVRNERLQALPNYINWYERYKEMLPRSMALEAIIKTDAPLPPDCPDNYSYGEFHASATWREYKKEQSEHFDTVHQAEQDLIALKRVVFGDSRAPEALEKQHDDFLLGGSNV
jgi:hypothetical protein